MAPISNKSIKEQMYRASAAGVQKAVETDGRISKYHEEKLCRLMDHIGRKFHIEIVVEAQKGVSALTKTIDTDKLAQENIRNLEKFIGEGKKLER